MREQKQGHTSSKTSSENYFVRRRKMCWLPADQPLLLPGDSCSSRRPSPCSVAQLLASRLRRIGDRLEKSWAAGETPEVGYGCGDRPVAVAAASASAAAAAADRGRMKGFLRIAVRFTVLVLFVARRHL